MKAPKKIHELVAAPFVGVWDKICELHQRHAHNKDLSARRKAIGKALMDELQKRRHEEAIERIEQQAKDMPYYPDGYKTGHTSGGKGFSGPDSSRSPRW